MKQYTVSQMAQLSGVSVRALHHYDEIGLLKPAHLGANGYRYYGREELLRLQQILFHRELGLGLEQIRALLDDATFDRLAALKAHRGKLESESARFGHLIRTIDRTIAELNGEQQMSDKDLYQGFSPQKQAQWEREIVEKFGDSGREKIEESKRNFSKMSKEDMAAGKAEMEAINLAFAAAMAAGEAPGCERVQALTARHYAWVCRAWKPNKQAYIGMGQMYVSHADFRATYDAVRPGLAEYLAAAMKVYAESSLGD
ncbi:MAG TPA: MerR family transcriptional regulator [Rhizomicrobium sp.]